jgi:hypothetical protein
MALQFGAVDLGKKDTGTVAYATNLSTLAFVGD